MVVAKRWIPELLRRWQGKVLMTNQMWVEGGGEGREDAKSGELDGWLCFLSAMEAQELRIGWREDDEEGLGYFEFEVYLGHPSRDTQSVRGLRWRHNMEIVMTTECLGP